MSWLRQLIGLLLRAKALRALVIAAIVATALPAIIAGLRVTTELPRDREISDALGIADALIAEQGEPVLPGASLDMNSPYKLSGVQQTVVWRSTPIPLVGSDSVTKNWILYEGTWPSMATDTSVRLVEGRWPRKPGECVATTSTSRLASPVGDWNLDIMGRIEAVADPRVDSRVYCAPGSWATFNLDKSIQPLTDQSVSRSVYAKGDLNVIREEAKKSFETNPLGYVITRDSFQPKVRIGQVLSDIAPWLILSAVTIALIKQNPESIV